MRVLHVVPGLASRTGGVATSTIQSCLAVEAHGVATTILTTDLAEAASAKRHRRVTSEELPHGADQLDVRIFRARPPYRLAFSPALHRAAGRTVGSFDVVHIHSLFLFPQWSAFHHACRAGVPFVVSPRGSLDPYLRRRGRVRKTIVSALWQRRMLEHAAALLPTTDAEAALLADVAPTIPRVVVPNPIEWAIYQSLPDRDAFRRRYLTGHSGRVVLSLGRLSHKKGLDILIGAFARVHAQIPDCTLVIAGPDDEGLQPRLAALAAREGVGGATVFTGMLTGRDRLAALAAADVWALSSHTENFGVAVVEALAAGIPTVISPAVNLAPEAEAAAALLVSDLDPECFATAILTMLRDSDRAAALGERGRSFARRYDRAAVGGQLVEAYELAAQTSASAPEPLAAAAGGSSSG